jgi:hypothetical protein
MVLVVIERPVSPSSGRRLHALRQRPRVRSRVVRPPWRPGIAIWIIGKGTDGGRPQLRYPVRPAALPVRLPERIMPDRAQDPLHRIVLSR